MCSLSGRFVIALGCGALLSVSGCCSLEKGEMQKYGRRVSCMVGQVCGGGAPPLTIQNRAVAHAVIPVLIRGSFRASVAE